MSEQSPTGTPRMSPRRVPLYLALALGASATLAAAGQMLPEQYQLARVVCTVLGVGISTFAGVASPGLRLHGGKLLVLLAAGLTLQGCARFQQPQPIGEPSPLACYGAKRTREAWEQLIRTYVDEMMAAQEKYSCQPPPPAAPAQ